MFHRTIYRVARMRDVTIVAFVKWGVILVSFAAMCHYVR